VNKEALTQRTRKKGLIFHREGGVTFSMGSGSSVCLRSFLWEKTVHGGVGEGEGGGGGGGEVERGGKFKILLVEN